MSYHNGTLNICINIPDGFELTVTQEHLHDLVKKELINYVDKKYSPSIERVIQSKIDDIVKANSREVISALETIDTSFRIMEQEFEYDD